MKFQRPDRSISDDRGASKSISGRPSHSDIKKIVSKEAYESIDNIKIKDMNIKTMSCYHDDTCRFIDGSGPTGQQTFESERPHMLRKSENQHQFERFLTEE